VGSFQAAKYVAMTWSMFMRWMYVAALSALCQLMRRSA